MADALLRDLRGEPVLLMRDARLAGTTGGGCHRTVLVEGMDAWETLLRRVEAVWIIAPETDGVLECYSEKALQNDKILLGSRPEAIAVCASKLLTIERLQANGVPCVPGWPLAAFRGQVPPPWVIKPMDGVGCEGVFRVERVPDDGKDWLVQPYVTGEAMSLSAVFAQGEAVCISVNRQHVDVNASGGFRLRGCQVNVMEPCGRWQRLCDQVAAALPGLWGYVGIDVILTDRGPLIVEVNPRLTLSYVGLRAALGGNLAAQIIDLASGLQSISGLHRWREKLGPGSSVWVTA